LVWRQTGVFGDSAHGDRVNRVVSWDDKARLAVRHDNVATLSGDAKAEFLKNADGVLMANARDFGHGIR